MKRLLICITIIFCVIACESIKYQSDNGYACAAQSNSPEWPVYVNGKICKDMDDQIGICSKRVKSNEEITLKFEKRPYTYRIHLQCTKDTGIDFSKDVPTTGAFEYTIKPSQFATLRMFTCIGEIFPNDREEPISAKFEVRIVVVDQNYLKREIMDLYKYKGQYYLLLGQHAKYSIVYDNKNGKPIKTIYKEATIVKVHDPKKVKAVSESFSMRFNQYGN